MDLANYGELDIRASPICVGHESRSYAFKGLLFTIIKLQLLHLT
jgi:hypothetical protein